MVIMTPYLDIIQYTYMNSGRITLMLLAVDVACSRLKILRTIPVTSCKAKRSFSALCSLKYLQSSIGQDRLNGLALLHIRTSRC